MCFMFMQRGDVHTLHIPEVFYEDSGKFSVRAVNRAGQVTSTAELIVEGMYTVCKLLHPQNVHV